MVPRPSLFDDFNCSRITEWQESRSFLALAGFSVSDLTKGKRILKALTCHSFGQCQCLWCRRHLQNAACASCVFQDVFNGEGKTVHSSNSRDVWKWCFQMICASRWSPVGWFCWKECWSVTNGLQSLIILLAWVYCIYSMVNFLAGGNFFVT